MIFLIDWQWIWFKITLSILNPENHQVCWWTSAKCCYFKIVLSIHIVFQYQSKIIRVIELKKKRIKFFFIAVIYEHIKTILYVLRKFSDVYVDSDQEPSYNLSKIFYDCLGYWSWWKIWYMIQLPWLWNRARMVQNA